MATLTFLSACLSRGSPDVTPKLWSVEVGGYGASVLSGDLLLGYTPEEELPGARISAFSLSQRKVLWRSERSLAFDASAIQAADETAVYVFLNGRGLCIYSRSGELLAQVSPPDGAEARGGAFGAAPTLLGTKLFVPNGPHLYVYNVEVPSEPSMLWQRTFSNNITALTVDADTVLVGGVSQGAKANVLRLSANDGRELWAGNLEEFGRSTPFATAMAVSGENVFIYSFELTGSLQAFDRQTGRHLWTAPLNNCSDGAGFVNALEVGGNTIFFSPSLGSCLFAVDQATGEELWTVETGEVGPDGAISIGGRPLYHNGVVYTSVERLWAVDAGTGRVLSFASQRAENTTDTFIHYANGEILVWGDELTAYKPVR